MCVCVYFSWKILRFCFERGVAKLVLMFVPLFVRSNMSACYEKLQDWDNAAEAGRGCIKADSKFIKGYYRLAVAQKGLEDYNGCIKTLESGIALDSTNPDLKRIKKEVVELQRKKEVAALCEKVTKYDQSGDIVNAYKTLQLASRQDAGNPAIERLKIQIEPKYERYERQRKAGLSRTELDKEKGDELFKQASFEEAIKWYTKCIDKLGMNDTSTLMIKARSNRAACYKQISNFDGTIEDCTMVLEIEHENVKALVRRAQAFEALERYRSALQDVKQVLLMSYHKVGKPTFDLCNQMQYRLQRNVATLKAMS